MNNIEVIEFVQEWLNEKELKSYFKAREKGKETYIKITEKDLYNLCYRLVLLIQENSR